VRREDFRLELGASLFPSFHWLEKSMNEGGGRRKSEISALLVLGGNIIT